MTLFCELVGKGDVLLKLLFRRNVFVFAKSGEFEGDEGHGGDQMRGNVEVTKPALAHEWVRN